MAVEVLFLTVVCRKRALEGLDLPLHQRAQRLFRWEPDWFREDVQLVATSFMCPRDVRRFGKALESTGLQRRRDWAVLDATTGATEPVSWMQWLEWVNDGTPLRDVPVVWADNELNNIVRVRSIVPGMPPEVCREVRTCKLFGRDHFHDGDNHREDFGRFIPAWGGRDVWLFEDPTPEPGDEGRWASINLDHLDFSEM